MVEMAALAATVETVAEAALTIGGVPVLTSPVMVATEVKEAAEATEVSVATEVSLWIALCMKALRLP